MWESGPILMPMWLGVLSWPGLLFPSYVEIGLGPDLHVARKAIPTGQGCCLPASHMGIMRVSAGTGLLAT